MAFFHYLVFTISQQNRMIKIGSFLEDETKAYVSILVYIASLKTHLEISRIHYTCKPVFSGTWFQIYQETSKNKTTQFKKYNQFQKEILEESENSNRIPTSIKFPNIKIKDEWVYSVKSYILFGETWKDSQTISLFSVCGGSTNFPTMARRSSEV